MASPSEEDVESALDLVRSVVDDIAKNSPLLTTLCGINPEETQAIRGRELATVDAILLAFDLRKNSCS